jgi:hypothetical protein
MNKKNVETYKMLTRTVDLITANVGWFPKSTVAASILKTLANGVARLTTAAAGFKSGEASMREASKNRASARTALRDLIGRASLVSRALHSETVRPPTKGSEHELMSIGRGFGDSTEELKKDFIGHGFPSDEVLGAVEALESAIRNHESAKTARSAALTEWNDALAEALDALIALDALAANVLVDNPVALASYEAARTIFHPRGRAPKAKEPSPAPKADAASAA